MARWGKLSYAQKTCLGKVGLLMQQAGMLREGARVGVAVSGGVDSFLLLQLLIMRRRIVPFSFEIMALHVNPGFDPVAHLPLAAWIREQGLAAHLELTDHGPRAHSPENRKGSACFFCARLRRKRLFALCRTYGLTHLAFAHTADDLAATFLMNLVLTGKVYGLAAREEYFGGELTLIRPLLGLDKAIVIAAARRFGLPWTANPCPSAAGGARAEMERLLEAISAGDRRRKRNIRHGLLRWQLDQIP
jgi:tRNA(Ile)-lysidine synthase TilS/MesJ